MCLHLAALPTPKVSDSMWGPVRVRTSMATITKTPRLTVKCRLGFTPSAASFVQRGSAARTGIGMAPTALMDARDSGRPDVPEPATQAKSRGDYEVDPCTNRANDPAD